MCFNCGINQRRKTLNIFLTITKDVDTLLIRIYEKIYIQKKFLDTSYKKINKGMTWIDGWVNKGKTEIYPQDLVNQDISV